MASHGNAPELFGVNVQQLAWGLALVALHGDLWVQGFEAGQTHSGQPAASQRLMVAVLRPTVWAIRLMGMRWRRSCSMRLLMVPSTLQRVRVGLEL